MDINKKVLKSAFHKIQKHLTVKEQDEFNKIRHLLFIGVDSFNEPLDHLRNLEREGLETIRNAMEHIGVFYRSEEGASEIWYFGKSNK
jgi:hypothetical protein